MNFQELKTQVLASPSIPVDVNEYGRYNGNEEIHLAYGEHGHAIYFEVDLQLSQVFDDSTGIGTDIVRHLYINITEVIWNGDKVSTTVDQDAGMSELIAELIRY